MKEDDVYRTVRDPREESAASKNWTFACSLISLW